jgi:Na+/proline symporter
MCALVLGMVAKQAVFWLVLFAWAGLGAALGPTSIMALYSKRTTRAGIFAGITVGTVTAVIWRYTPSLKAAMYELVPAFLLSALAAWLVSMFTKAPDDVDTLFDAMEK